MTEDPDTGARMRARQYELLLQHSGAVGLTPADLEELAVALASMDVKITLIRRRSAMSGGDFGNSPVAG